MALTPNFKIDADLLSGFAGLIWVDYTLIGLITLSAVMGLMRGLIREVYSLAVWGLAIWLGLHFSKNFSTYLDSAIPMPSARMAVAFLAIFIAILITGAVFGAFLNKLIVSTGLSGTDRLAGLLFGIARGVLIGAVLVLLAGVTPLPNDPWWKDSKLIPPFQTLALWLRDQLPASLASYVKYR